MNRYPARQRAIVAVLRAAREKAGLSQRQLSEMLGESPTYIHLIEAMRRDVPTAEFIAIALKLGREPDELLHQVTR